MKKFYVIVLIFLTCTPAEILSARKTKKKSYKTTTEAPATNTSQPAILAIEIVDPNENSTSSKHSKRTIEGSLGYGYNSFEASKPRYEVYKYSQHDIPPLKADASPVFQGSLNNQVNVQKSVPYSVPSTSQQVAASNNLLQPGTTLYSSLSEKGQVGSLSTTLPDVPSSGHNNVPVPVVVLRLYPHQLKDSTIQANLPKGHPFAKSINSLNIQTLLLQYIKTLKNPGTLSEYSVNHGSLGQSYQYSGSKGLTGQTRGSSSQYLSSPVSQGQNYRYTSQYVGNQGSNGQYHGSLNQYSLNEAPSGGNDGYSSQYFSNQGSLGHNTYSSNQDYASSVSSPVQPTNYQTSSYHNQDNYSNVPKYQNNNGGARNYMYYQQSYPQQSTQEYTRQSQYQQQNPDYNSGVTVVEAPIKYQITPYQIGNQWRYQTSSIQKPQISKTSVPTPQPQFYYVQPKTQNSYSTESSNYYQPAQLPVYTKPSAPVQTVAVPQQQYYAGNEESQNSGYHQDDGQQYEAKNQLLTHENYPTNKHTRVVFRTKTGDVQTPEQEESPSKEIKTIKIHVPDNIAKVEVQETERPYYTPEPTYSESKQQTKEQPAPADAYHQNEDLEKDISHDNYFLPPEALHQGYYTANNDQSASEVFYNYQNVDFEDMAKYFEKRGAMPEYFFQNPDDIEVVKDLSTEATKSTTDLVAAYEEAAFPSTTSSPMKKKVKSKKRVPM